MQLQVVFGNPVRSKRVAKSKKKGKLSPQRTASMKKKRKIRLVHALVMNPRKKKRHRKALSHTQAMHARISSKKHRKAKKKTVLRSSKAKRVAGPYLYIFRMGGKPVFQTKIAKVGGSSVHSAAASIQKKIDQLRKLPIGQTLAGKKRLASLHRELAQAKRPMKPHAGVTSIAMVEAQKRAAKNLLHSAYGKKKLIGMSRVYITPGEEGIWESRREKLEKEVRAAIHAARGAGKPASTPSAPARSRAEIEAIVERHEMKQNPKRKKSKGKKKASAKKHGRKKAKKHAKKQAKRRLVYPFVDKHGRVVKTKTAYKTRGGSAYVKKAKKAKKRRKHGRRRSDRVKSVKKKIQAFTHRILKARKGSVVGFKAGKKLKKFKRINPMGGNMAKSAKDMLKKITGHSPNELVGVAGGAVALGAIEYGLGMISAKVPAVATVSDKLAVVPGGLPLIAAVALQGAVGEKIQAKSAVASEVLKGAIAASLATTILDLVRAASGMAGVAAYMSGVRATPAMAGFLATPDGKADYDLQGIPHGMPQGAPQSDFGYRPDQYSSASDFGRMGSSSAIPHGLQGIPEGLGSDIDTDSEPLGIG